MDDLRSGLVKYFEQKEFEAFLSGDRAAEEIWRELSVDAYHDKLVDVSEIHERIAELEEELEETQSELWKAQEKLNTKP